MASGTLGNAVLSANSDTLVYTCPPDTVASINFNVVNRGFGNPTVRVAISPNTTPADSDYIEYGVVIPPGGILERTALVVNAGDRLVVHSSESGCTVRVYGFEDLTS